jgi:hypothetical protein
MNKAREYSSPLIEELINETTPEELEKINNEMEAMIPIKNGDVFDIGQTVNGVSKFLWFNDKWYYFEEQLSNEYEYDQDELTKLVIDNEFDEVTFIKNIFIKEEVDMGEMINVWIEYHGYLDLDTDEQVIVNFYNKIQGGNK